MSQKLLISACTSLYDHLGEDQQRSKLYEVVSSINELFTKLGYHQKLTELNSNPTAQNLRVELDKWFASDERQADDWVVFYYTGHGELVGSDALYLLTRESEYGFTASTAFPVSQLGDMLISPKANGESRLVRRLLLILDTCHSGAGAFELARKLSNLFSQGTNGSMFYILAAAFPNEEAMSGALAKALIEALESEATKGKHQEFIYFDQLIPVINQKLRTHQVVYLPVSSPNVAPEFFPNPYYIGKPMPGLTVAEVRRAADQRELIHHWAPVSRGVEVEQQSGWYFTGRDKLLQEISDWLNDPADCKTRIITGKAGAGKSAILSRIVTISDPEYRRKIPSSDRHWIDSFPTQSIDIAVHAKGKTLDEVVNRIAKYLNINPTRSAIINDLKGRPNPLRIVIDALDEASEPDRIARELLEPLNSFLSVKLLVGTRPTYLEALGSDVIVIHVDTPNYLEKEDFENYIEARLLAQGDPNTQTPYYQEEVLARQLAKAVAEKAYPNFLIGRLFAEYLISLPKPVDLAALQGIGIPSTIGQAFKQYLIGFKKNEQKVRDLLLPLAWAEGLGLPWNTIWASLASSLSNRAYSDEDIDWVLHHAGSFIIDTLDEGRSVYQLYHQGLSDYLREGHERTHIHQAIVETLMNTVPSFEDGTGKDWRQAHSYIRFHLAEHAVACGSLKELMDDPLYLLTADSNRLVSILNIHYNEISSDISQVYRKVIHHIRERPINEAASYLMLSAKKYGLTSLITHPSLQHLHLPWEVPWLHWQSETPSQHLAKGVSKITTMVTATWSNRPVVVLGRKNGAIEVWDVSDDIRLTNWQPDGFDFVQQLAFDQTSDGPILVAAWNNQHKNNYLGVYNCITGKSCIVPLARGEEIAVRASCITVRNGKPVCITAHKDSTLIIWELPSLNIVVKREKATKSIIYCLLPITLNGKSVLLSGGDHSGNNNKNNSILKLWSLDDLTPIWEDRSREKGIITYAESGMFFEKQLVVLSQYYYGPPEVWDLASHHRLFKDKDGTSTKRSWLYTYMDNVYLIGVKHGQLLIQKMRYTDDKGAPSLSSELISESISVEGDNFGNITQRYGRAVLLSAKDNYVHIWDIEELLEQGIKADKAVKLPPLTVMSMAASSTENEKLYVGSYEDVFTLNIKTGSLLSKRTLDGSGYISTIKHLPEQDALLVGTYKGHLGVIDLKLPDLPFHVITKENSIRTIRSIEWNNRTLVFATVQRGGWAVRIWDLSSKAEISTDVKYTNHCMYALTSGEEDKVMGGLAITETQNGIKLAFSSTYGQVMVGDFSNAEPELFGYRIWKVPHTNNEYINCLATYSTSSMQLLAAGTEYGDITVWDFTTGTPIISRTGVHIGEITALSFYVINKQQVLVSGGEDGVLYFSTTELHLMFSIEIGSPIRAIDLYDTNHLAVGTRMGVIMVKINSIL